MSIFTLKDEHGSAKFALLPTEIAQLSALISSDRLDKAEELIRECCPDISRVEARHFVTHFDSYVRPDLIQTHQEQSMTDRVQALLVILDHDIREDDIQPLVAAISLLKHVTCVKTSVADIGIAVATERAKTELLMKISEILR